MASKSIESLDDKFKVDEKLQSYSRATHYLTKREYQVLASRSFTCEWNWVRTRKDRNFWEALIPLPIYVVKRGGPIKCIYLSHQDSMPWAECCNSCEFNFSGNGLFDRMWQISPFARICVSHFTDILKKTGVTLIKLKKHALLTQLI